MDPNEFSGDEFVTYLGTDEELEIAWLHTRLWTKIKNPPLNLVIAVVIKRRAAKNKTTEEEEAATLFTKWAEICKSHNQ